MTELNSIQFDINIYYINRYILRLHFITYKYYIIFLLFTYLPINIGVGIY